MVEDVTLAIPIQLSFLRNPWEHFKKIQKVNKGITFFFTQINNLQSG